MSGYKRVNFYDLCRLCATHQLREKTHIFEERGRKIQLQNKIEACLALQVCENDFLPKVVCSKCLENLERSNIFRQECDTSEKMLVSYFNNFRYTEEFKKSGKVYIKDISQKSVGTEINTDHNATPVVTLASAGTTNTDCNLNLLSNILPQEIMSSFYTLQLPQVSTLATTAPVLQQATPIVTTTPLIQQVQENQKVVSQPQIIYNNKPAPNIIKSNLPGSISLRVNSNGEIISTAPLIELNPYANQQKYVAHRKIPDNANIVKIDLTGDVEKPHSSLAQPVVYNQIQNNFNRVTNMNLISIPYDSIVINSQPLEESPSSTPSPPPTVPVYSVPSQTLSDAFTPTSSQSSQSSQSSPLDVFAQSPATKSTCVSLQDESECEKERTYSCSACLKNFKKRELLYQHVKLHSGFRPYKCQKCNKSYIRKEHLMRHLTSHNGEKKFMCDTCRRCFSRHDNLLKHKKTHDRHNYTCDVCQRKFLLEHFFVAHKTTHGLKCGILGLS